MVILNDDSSEDGDKDGDKDDDEEEDINQPNKWSGLFIAMH